MAELEDVAAELYGLPLEEFTAARDARAKELRADGARTTATALRGLRRPSTAAWAVNQLVRARSDEVEQVLALGAALREAQAAFAGDEMRTLTRQQHQLVTAVRREAQKVARERGQRLSETVAREVEATLKAAMADADAAAAVRSGMLLRALENTGFTSVDLDGAVALPEVLPAYGGRPQLRLVRDDVAAEDREEGSRRSHQSGDDQRRDGRPEQQPDKDEQRQDQQRQEEDRRREEERRRAEERGAERRRAQEELDAAQAVLAREESAHDEARRAVEDLTDRRTELRRRLERLRAELAELGRRLEEAEREDEAVSDEFARTWSARDDAEAAVRRAAREQARARARLEELTDE